MNWFRLLFALLFSLSIAGCPPRAGGGDDDDSATDDDDAADDDDDATPVDFAMWSDDLVEPYFENPRDCDQALPIANSCLGRNPEISWEGAPEGTVSFALIFDDPTAGNFPHWAIWDIPGDATGLAADISGGQVTSNLPSGAFELANGGGFMGYLGSCPGPGSVNQYSWRLYALDTTLGGDFSAFGQVESAAQGAELGMVDMCHVFDGDNSDF